jgi:hypothetical protein
MSANFDGGKPDSSHQIAAMSAGSRADATARQAWQLAGGWTGVCRQPVVHSHSKDVLKENVKW